MTDTVSFQVHSYLETSLADKLEDVFITFRVLCLLSLLTLKDKEKLEASLVFPLVNASQF